MISCMFSMWFPVYDVYVRVSDRWWRMGLRQGIWGERGVCVNCVMYRGRVKGVLFLVRTRGT